MRFPRSESETLPQGFEEALRRTFLDAPSPATEDRHLTMIEAADAEAAAARTESVRPARPYRERRSPRPALIRVAATLAAAVLALPVVFGGLALAGVSLPEPIDSAFEAVGLDLPNQRPDGDDDDGDGAREDGLGSAGAAEGQSTAGDDDDRSGAASGERGAKGEEPGDGGRKDSDGAQPGASGVAGSDSNGRPTHATDGQTGAPPHSQQGGQGVGTPPPQAQDGVGGPPPHAQDGAGGQPPHAQGGATAQPKPPKAVSPKPTPVAPKPKEPKRAMPEPGE
jgi:hypothetical protein